MAMLTWTSEHPKKLSEPLENSPRNILSCLFCFENFPFFFFSRLSMLLKLTNLEKIRNHKYKPGVYTKLDLFLSDYWWSPLIEYMPKTIAPNLITLIGTVVIVGIMLISLWLNSPWWMFLLQSVGIFFYQTMDALDGKQARRTNSSSPLGQLFDHGCDCLVSSLLVFVPITSLNIQNTNLAMIITLITQTTFYFGQWEEHHTGILNTSIGGVFGISEIQAILIFTCFISGVFGANVWETPVFGGFNVLNYRHLYILTTFTSTAAAASSCFYRMYHFKEKKISILSAVDQLFPVTILILSGWMIKKGPLYLSVLAISLCYVRLTTAMILSTVSGLKFPTFYLSHMPLLAIGILHYLELFPDMCSLRMALITALGIETIDLSVYVYQAVTEIAKHLKIKVFTI
jgi:ethanolaminephosphotransferase